MKVAVYRPRLASYSEGQRRWMALECMKLGMSGRHATGQLDVSHAVVSKAKNHHPGGMWKRTEDQNLQAAQDLLYKPKSVQERIKLRWVAMKIANEAGVLKKTLPHFARALTASEEARKACEKRLGLKPAPLY